MDRYDPDHPVDPEAWLSLDEETRRLRIAEAHPVDGDLLHPEGMHHGFHCGLHAVVETQIATGDPPEVAETLARLEAAGLRRHPALHAIAEALMPLLVAPGPFSTEAYRRRLAGIDPAAWLSGRLPRR